MVHKLNQTSQKILREAQSGKIFLLDGATGTFLQNPGLEPSDLAISCLQTVPQAKMEELANLVLGQVP